MPLFCVCTCTSVYQHIPELWTWLLRYYLQEVVGKVDDDETEECVKRLQVNKSFGEVSFLCNTPQPYTVQVLDLCRVLRLDKQCFKEILGICSSDGRIILNNLLEVNCACKYPFSSCSSFHLISVTQKIWSMRDDCQCLRCFLKSEVNCVHLLAK